MVRDTLFRDRRVRYEPEENTVVNKEAVMWVAAVRSASVRDSRRKERRNEGSRSEGRLYKTARVHHQ